MKRTILCRIYILANARIYIIIYRKPMRVTEIMIYPSPNYGETGYYVCPKCKTTLEREFVRFCDRCGQRLDWSNYRNAKPLYPRPRVKSMPDKSLKIKKKTPLKRNLLLKAHPLQGRSFAFIPLCTLRPELSSLRTACRISPCNPVPVLLRATQAPPDRSACTSSPPLRRDPAPLRQTRPWLG